MCNLTRENIVDFCMELGNVSCDYPFKMDNNHCVARHTANRKWFALIHNMNNRLCVNLKCEPMQAEFLRQVYSDVVLPYHMNKVHWNTVYLNGDVPNQAVFSMIEDSFELTKSKIKIK